MEIEIHPEILEELVELARTITRSGQHPVLIAGLQPAKDYEFANRMWPGMATGRSNIVRKLREARIAERLWQLSVLADILRDSACLDEVAPSQMLPHWWSVDCFRTGLSYGFSQEEIEAAALAKARLRAACPCPEQKSPAERDVRIAEENAAIQAALDALPWPGIPIGEIAARYGIPEITLRTAKIPRRRAGNVIIVNTRDPRWHGWLDPYLDQRRKKAEESEASGQ